MRIWITILLITIYAYCCSQTQTYIEELKVTPNDSISKLLVLKDKLISSVPLDYKDTTAFDTYNSIALTFYGKNQPKIAEEFFNLALNLAKNIGDVEKTAQMLSNIGVMREITGDYVGALSHYHKAVDAFIESKDIKGQSLVFNNIAIVHQELGNHNQVLPNLIQSYTLKKQLNDTLLIASALNNLGVFYEESKLELDSAIYYYKEAMALYKAMGDIRNEAICLNNTGVVLLKLRELEEARTVFFQTAEIFRELNDKVWLSKSLLYAGQVEMEDAQLPKSVTLLEEAYALVEESEYIRHAMDVSGVLAAAYLKAGNFEKSAQVFATHTALKDSIVNIDKQKEIKKLEIMFRTAQKELEIENLKHTQEIREQKFRQIVLSIGIIIVFLSFIIVFLYMKGRQRKLYVENKNMHIKQQILQQQMNPHFLFNVLTSIQSFLHKDEKQKTSAYLSKFSRLTRMVLQSSAQETISLKEEINLLSDYIALEQLRTDSPFTYNFTMNAIEDADEIQIPPMLVQPFVENAIKHAFKDKSDGILELDVRESAINSRQYIIFTVTDNGSGMHKTKDNNNTHKSLALDIIQERKNILNKKWGNHITINYLDVSKGTKVALCVPIL